MGLSPKLIQSHLDTWSARLKKTGNRPYRQHWPSRLFRHEPLENAVRILQSGKILSREDSKGQIVRDIAPQEIIMHSDAAHHFVRLYFRPKNPTQYRIEGIRKPEEYYKGCHAPVLIILIFSAVDILTGDG